MKQLPLSDTTYKVWANEQLLQLAAELLPEEQNRIIISGFLPVTRLFCICGMLQTMVVQIYTRVIRPSLVFNLTLHEYNKTAVPGKERPESHERVMPPLLCAAEKTGVG